MLRRRYPLLRALRPLLRGFVSSPRGLAAVNRAYRVLSPRQKRRFLSVFGTDDFRPEGYWAAAFCGKPVVLRLRRDLPVTWRLALSFEGQEIEVHSLFERFLRSPRRPRVFFDVGAYYGLHSLKFLIHGVRAIAFEPNPSCHAYLEDCCRANGLEVEIQPVAVADRPGWAELCVPGDDPYLATVAPEVKARFAGRTDVRTLRVRQTSLDHFIGESEIVPDLIKIDAEGGELRILNGSRELLGTRQPVLVFESWKASPDRKEIFALLDGLGYRVHRLRYPARAEMLPMTLEEFLACESTNYTAFTMEG